MSAFTLVPKQRILCALNRCVVHAPAGRAKLLTNQFKAQIPYTALVRVRHALRAFELTACNAFSHLAVRIPKTLAAAHFGMHRIHAMQ
jgi:hypothetical protein